MKNDRPPPEMKQPPSILNMKALSLPSTWILLSLSFALGIVSCKQSVEPSPSIRFTKEIIFEDFIGEGVAVADVNRDGTKDLLAGAFWFEGPSWQRHEIRPPVSFDPNTEWSDAFFSYSMDVDQDGWMDMVQIGFPGAPVYWYQNPQGAEQHWAVHLIDSAACNESPMFVDVDADGRKDLVFGNEATKEMFWFRPPDKGSGPAWEKIAISVPDAPGTTRFSHGLGFSDLNGDGRKDILIRQGWWEAPEDRRQVPWAFHEVDLGEPCSQMYTLDFDQDGDQDVFSSSAHAYGIWWHEQIEDNGSIAFRRHLVDSSFSQTHAVALADLNADGSPDLVTGKRYFAHNGKDPGGMEAAVLYWIESLPDANGNPDWQFHQIDDDSGVGVHTVVEDVNGDGKLDILNANKKGVICFFQE